MKKILHLLSFILCINLTFGQIGLTGTSYTQNFDGIGAAGPAGWSFFTGATATSLGSSASFTNGATAWATTSTGFRNSASADGLMATATSAVQAASTDRSLSVRQSGSFGDPGAAFAVRFTGTTGRTSFNLSFKLQSLDNTSGRTTTWEVQYGVGAIPTTFTTVTTVPAALTTGGSSFTNTAVSVNFGNALDNNPGQIWIRLVALNASGGSGNRATTGLDDFVLTWTNTASPTPVISVVPSIFTGLDYVAGSGPSASQSGVVSGSNLTGTVSGSAVTNFEFSVDNITFGAFPGPISGAAITVVPTTVYVRLKAGLAVGVYNETLTLSNTGGSPSNASAVNVSLSGEVTAAPIVCTPSLQALPYTGIAGVAGFDHTTSNPPPAAPAEVCGTNFLLSYTSIPATDGSTNEFGNQSNIGLTGLSSADFGGEASFETYPIDVSGVTAVTIDAVGATQGASVFNGAAEYFEWWYTLDGGPQVVFFTTTSDGPLNATVSPLDVTGVNALVVGFSFNVNGDTDGFEGMDVSVVEYVPVPLISVSATSFTGLDYVAGSGPSVSQSGVISGTNLTGSVSGSAITNFEFSLDNITFGAFPGPISGAALTVLPTTVYVRLKAGLAVGPYSEILTLSNSGGSPSNAASVAITFSGEVTAPVVPCNQLFISEYGEPNTGTDKYIEIYNPTSGPINLSNYQIWIVSNGGTWPENSIGLSGTLASGDVYVIADAGFINPNVDLGNNTVTGFNGDDAIGLAYNGGSGTTFTLIDAVGEDGLDPGTGWNVAGVTNGTVNSVLVRKASVQSPNTNWSASAGTNTSNSEWEVFTYTGGMSLPNLGNHTSSCIVVTNTWEGDLSTDWSTGGNWSTGSVPNTSDVVIIPTTPIGGLFPLTSADITVSDLTVQTGASLTIGAGFGLIISANGTVVNTGTVSLAANSSGSAWLDDFTNSNTTYTGNITAQQYVATGFALGQRMFGSPVSNGLVLGLNQAYASGSNGQQTIMTNCASAQVTQSSPYNNLFEWRENATTPNGCEYEGWFTKSQGTSLENGRGYSGWMNNGSIISFTGQPNTGSIAYGSSALGNSGLTNIFKDGWHVLSNPYPSNISTIQLTFANWASPQTYNASSAAYGGTFQPITPGQEISSAQGFVMKSMAPGNTANFTNAMRTQGSTQFKSGNDWFDAKLDIEVSKGNKADITYIYFNGDATQSFDNTWDCEKRQSDAGLPTLYTSTTGVNTSLNGNNIAEMGNYAFPLGLKPGSNGTFTFTIDGINSFPATSLIYLEDKETGTWTNLRENSVYAFDMTTLDAELRFEVHFSKPIALTFEGESCDGNDGTINVDFGNQSINGNLQSWNYELRKDQQVLLNANESDLVAIEDLEPGAYEITFTNGTLQTTEYITIEDRVQVNANFNLPSLQVYTGDEVFVGNLSTGADAYTWAVNNEFINTTDLSYTFLTAGNYQVRLNAANADCDDLYEQTIEVLNKTTGIAEQIALDRVLVYTKDNSIVIDLSNANLEGQTDLQVYDLLGKLIVQKLNVKTIEQIEMANHARGYYFVNIINQHEQITKKVIIK